jgi:ubiquinone/menaquinone biosynthesis C-methylase UbiE
MAFLERIPDGWQMDGPILFHALAGLSQEADAYASAQGCQQRERSLDPFQSGYYDFVHYSRILGQMCAELPQDACVVDMGCGDGRFSKLVLNTMSRARVIAVDFNASDLQRLWDTLDEEERERTTLVSASVDEVIPWDSVADAVILSEVAYTLKEPIKAYHAAWRCLKLGGLAMVSNVAKQAYFVHALLNGDWTQIERILYESKYVDIVRGQNENRVEVHLYDVTRMRQEAEMSGFEVVDISPIPAEPSLLLHAMKIQKNAVDLSQNLLAKAATQHTGIDRLYISSLRKGKAALSSVYGWKIGE